MVSGSGKVGTHSLLWRATADGVILSTRRFDLKRIDSDVRNAARLGGRCVYWSSGLSIVVWAMSVAPIAFVAALCGTSILFAMLIGWLLFKDKMDWLKMMAGVLIVVGVLLTRF